MDRYRKLKKISLAEGRSIAFLLGKAIDLFLTSNLKTEDR